MQTRASGSIHGHTRHPADARGDFLAQIGANCAGVARLRELIEGTDAVGFRRP